jgi:hypothetical protein
MDEGRQSGRAHPEFAETRDIGWLIREYAYHSVDYALTAFLCILPAYTIPTYRVLYNRHPILPNPRPRSYRL